MHPHALRRGTLTALSTGLVLLMAAGPAAAHVSVDPKAAEQGGYTTLAFHVPDERPASSTVKVEVVLPTDQPLLHVSARPLPGWTVSTETRALPKPIRTDDGDVTTAVTKITWTGGKVQPGEFQEFEISAGPLPDHGDRMVFKALQTYDNGEVVRWIDAPTADGSEPEHPAPVLQLTPADAPATPAATAAAAAQTPKSPTVTADTQNATLSGSATQDGSARLLAGAALATALLALLLGLGARARAARTARTAWAAGRTRP